MAKKSTRKPLGELLQVPVKRGRRAKTAKGRNNRERSGAEKQQSSGENATYHPMPRVHHDATALLPEEIKDKATPLTIFELFWTEEVLQAIADNTNAYARLHGAEEFSGSGGIRRIWKRTSSKELRVFLGILIALGVFRCKSPSDLWRMRGPGGIQIHLTGFNKSISKSMSNNRFFQIRRYLHVSPPDTASDNWWEKLEPLNSQLCNSSMKYYLPATNVTVDEMMIRFGGRSKHIIRMPNKPITEGYKVFAICDHGYTINWRYHSRVKGIQDISTVYRESVGISAPSVAVVYQLAEHSLPYHTHDFVVYMDNFFSTIQLFVKLHNLGIGACGTARVQAGRYPEEYNNTSSDIIWNSVSGSL